VASYQIIYAQPMAREIPLIERPTLFIMGANDHNAPGRPFAPPELRAKMVRTCLSRMRWRHAW
jgi:proline iminopeptidase